MIRINIVMTCYAPVEERGAYALKTLYALTDKLKAPLPIRLIIADDGFINCEGPNFLPARNMRYLAESVGWEVYETFSSRHGIGGSLNAAMTEVDVGDLWFYITDDWVLTQPLDLGPAVRLIEAGYDYVRVNPVHPNLTCRTKFQQEIGWWLQLHHANDDGFYFATRPFLATRTFYDVVGPFMQGVDAYVTERDYSDRVNQHRELSLAALVDMHGPWEHCGVYEVGDKPPSRTHA